MAQKKKFPRKYLYLLLGLVAIVVVVAALEFTNTTYIFHKKKVVDTGAKTTSTSPTAQPTYTSPTSERTPSTASTNSGDGGVVDTQGATVASNPNPVVSTSGVISLLAPTQGQTIQPGSSVSGTAKVPTVQYRLVDNSVGMISQGSLNVVGGKFSGTLQFTKHGNTGTFVVYSIDPNTGAEINRASVDVAF